MPTNRRTVTVTETIHVARSPEDVFDYTQDYATRSAWDRQILAAEVLGDAPRRVRLKARGLGTFLLEYQLFRRGDRTSAAFRDLRSPIVSGGGGSWRYEPAAGGTDWTQTNTLEMRYPRLFGWMAGYLERTLRAGTREAMAAAKSIMESPSTR